MNKDKLSNVPNGFIVTRKDIKEIIQHLFYAAGHAASDMDEELFNKIIDMQVKLKILIGEK